MLAAFHYLSRLPTAETILDCPHLRNSKVQRHLAFMASYCYFLLVLRLCLIVSDLWWFWARASGWLGSWFLLINRAHNRKLTTTCTAFALAIWQHLAQAIFEYGAPMDTERVEGVQNRQDVIKSTNDDSCTNSRILEDRTRR